MLGIVVDRPTDLMPEERLTHQFFSDGKEVVGMTCTKIGALVDGMATGWLER